MLVKLFVFVLFNTNLFVATDTCASTCSCVTRLHLEHSLEQVLGSGRQEVDLGVGVETVQVRTLSGQRLVDVGVVALVVRTNK